MRSEKSRHITPSSIEIDVSSAELNALYEERSRLVRRLKEVTNKIAHDELHIMLEAIK